MPVIPAGQLKRGHRVVLPDGNGIKVIAKIVEVVPECLAESYITYSDGTTDQWCNFKNIMIVSIIPDAKVSKES